MTGTRVGWTVGLAVAACGIADGPSVAADGSAAETASFDADAENGAVADGGAGAACLPPDGTNARADTAADGRKVDGYVVPPANAEVWRMSACPGADCLAPTCDASAWTDWQAWHLQQKQSGALCHPSPDATCVDNVLLAGASWTAEVDAKIAQLDASLAVHLSARQKRGLRCLGYASRASDYKLHGHEVGTPRIELSLPVQGNGQPLKTALERWGPAIGDAFELTSGDAFLVAGLVVSPSAGGGGAFEFKKRTHRGIPVRSDSLDIAVSLAEPCTQLYRVWRVDGRITRGLDAFDLKPGAYLSATDAQAKALAACGACQKTNDVPMLDFSTDKTGKPHLVWTVRLAAQVTDNQGKPKDWFRRLEIDAYSGAVLLNVVECCIG